MRFLHCEFNLIEGCIPVGMTCGVLLAVCFAPRHTIYASALCLGAPVRKLPDRPRCPGASTCASNELGYSKRAYNIEATGLLSFRQQWIPLFAGRVPSLIYDSLYEPTPYPENSAPPEIEYRTQGL